MPYVCLCDGTHTKGVKTMQPNAKHFGTAIAAAERAADAIDAAERAVAEAATVCGRAVRAEDDAERMQSVMEALDAAAATRTADGWRAVCRRFAIAPRV